MTDRREKLRCDAVLLAIGQSADLSLLGSEWKLRDGCVDGSPGVVFAAGDVATNEGTVAHAIGNGRRAAARVVAALEGTHESPRGAEREPAIVAPAQIRFHHFEHATRAEELVAAADERAHHFREVNAGIANGPAEAARCFSCGHCTNCDTCLVYCPEGIIRRVGARTNEARGVTRAPSYLIDDAICKGCGICVAECPRCAMEMV